MARCRVEQGDTDCGAGSLLENSRAGIGLRSLLSCGLWSCLSQGRTPPDPVKLTRAVVLGYSHGAMMV